MCRVASSWPSSSVPILWSLPERLLLQSRLHATTTTVTTSFCVLVVLLLPAAMALFIENFSATSFLRLDWVHLPSVDLLPNDMPWPSPTSSHALAGSSGIAYPMLL